MLQKNLQQLFDEYISQCEHTSRLRIPTIISYKAAFKHFATIMPEITLPGDLNEQRMHDFLRRINVRERAVGKGTKVQGVKVSTVHTYCGRLRAFFEWLVDHEHLEENPLKVINIPLPEYTDRRALKKSEVEKIYTAITLIPRILLHCAVILLLSPLFCFVG